MTWFVVKEIVDGAFLVEPSVEPSSISLGFFKEEVSSSLLDLIRADAQIEQETLPGLIDFPLEWELAEYGYELSEDDTRVIKAVRIVFQISIWFDESKVSREDFQKSLTLEYSYGTTDFDLVDYETFSVEESFVDDDGETMKNRGKLSYQSGDIATARRWWEQAAAAGNTDAMSNLGVLAQNEGDPARAHQWFEQAATAGNTVAMYNLGNIAYGEVDLPRAQEWWQRAADLGHSGAMKNLEAHTRDGENTHETKGSGDYYSQLNSQLINIRDETAQILKELDDE